MSNDDVVALLREFRYRRGEFAGERPRLQFIARVYRVLPAGTVSRRIFQSADVERVPYKVVASQMGMSLRHFFRLRNEMVAQITRSWTIDVIEVAPQTNHDILQLEFARRSLENGHPSTAKETVERLMRSRVGAAETVEALLVTARAEFDAGTYDVANARIAEAKHALNALEPADREALNRDVAMTQAYGLYHDGAYQAALEVSCKTLPLIELYPSGTPYDVRKLARHAIFVGVQCQEIGLPHQCLQYLQAARALLQSLEHPPASEMAAIYLHMVGARVALPSEALAAQQDADEAVRLAEWHGLRAELAHAHLAKAMSLYASGSARESVEWAHRALGIARESLSGDPMARTLFITSRFESAYGLGAQAVAHVLEAKPLVEHHGLLNAIYYGALARARRAAGEIEGVIEAASQNIRLMEGRSDSPYIGLGYLQRAAARHQRGDAEVADDAEAAVDYLLRGAPLNDQVNALELSFRVTGNKRHRNEAAEIKQVVSAASA